MDKYGVEESEDKTAEVKETNICPTCGSRLEDQTETGVLKCLECGTKPFEK